MLKKIVIALVAAGVVAGSVFYYFTQQEAPKQQVTFEQNQAPVAPELPPITNTDLYQSFKLRNGMEVFVIPNKSIPAVSHMVWYRVGAKDEPAGKSGIAHLLEHLMFKGTERFPKGEFSRIIAENGGQENAFTSQDFTAYYQNVPTAKLEQMMEMEADRMKNLTFNDKEFQTERAVVMEEYGMRMTNEPRSLMVQELDAALFRNHPYGKQVIGWKHEILALNRDDAYAFHQKYYDPANAVLIVAGEVDAKNIQILAEKYYGIVPSNYVNDRKAVIEPPRVAATKITYQDARVEQKQFWQKFIAPSYTDKDAAKLKQAFALEVFARMLGGGTSSILYKSLVVEQKLASAAGAGYNGYSFGPSEFTVFAYPQDGVSDNVLEAAIDAEIAKVQNGEVSKKRIGAVKTAMIAEQIYEREGLQQMAYKIGQNYIIGLPPEFVKDWEVGVNSVTKDDIIEAAKMFLQSQKSVIGVLEKTPEKTPEKVEEKPADKEVTK